MAKEYIDRPVRISRPLTDPRVRAKDWVSAGWKALAAAAIEQAIADGEFPSEDMVLLGLWELLFGSIDPRRILRAETISQRVRDFRRALKVAKELQDE